jgi:hypothetical protein
MRDTNKIFCETLINEALSEYEAGHQWIIQEECCKKNNYLPIEATDELSRPEMGYARTSCYCTHQGVLGAETIFSKHFKVGGSSHNHLSPCIFESYL